VDAHGLVKRFGEITALDGVDVRVEGGRVQGLLGPNGAGKTTLLRILFGLVRPDAGSVRLLGEQLDTSDARLPDGVGGFVEDPRFYPYLSARRNLKLLSELDEVRSAARIGEALELVGLADTADRRVGGFSTGMRQRLGLAAALLREPALLLLDEPTVGLDPAGVREMRALLRKLADGGTAVLLSTHDMAEVDDVCDGVTIMRSGRVVWDGTVQRLRAEAPAPDLRLCTSNDARALEIARGHMGVTAVSDQREGLVVSAEDGRLDAYVLALGQAGIAVRRLELLAAPLESMFFALTGSGSDTGAELDAA
jgi:ABC-2 type transport system ATP-binding protein